MKRRLFLLAAAAALATSCAGNGDPMVEAETAFAKNDYRAARIHLLTVLKDDARDAGANLLYARTMLALGDGVAAEAALNKLSTTPATAPLLAHALLLRGQSDRALAATQGADDALAAWVRVRALADLDRAQEADSALDRALARYPADAKLLALRGTRQIAARNISGATASAAAALKADPDSLDALLLDGQLAVMRQDLKAAKARYARATKLYPDSIVPLFSLGAVEADLGDRKAAQEHLDRVLEIAPGHPMALFLTARLAFDAGDLPRARALMREADGSLEDFPGALLLSGEIAYLSGNVEQGIEKLRRFLADSPGHVQATTVLGAALEQTGDTKAAFALVRPVAERASATPALLKLAARLARKTGADATGFARRANAGAARDDAAVLLTRADKLMAAKDWSGARAIYAELRDAGMSDNAMVLNNAALVAMELGQGGEAVELARAAHALTPRDPAVIDTLGWIVLKTGGDRVEALRLLQAAADGAPGNLEIRWHLANALAANGKRADARRMVASLRPFAANSERAAIDRLVAGR